MKKSKKFLCLLLALVMAGSLLLLPAAAANTQSGATRYPTVYVHGLMGWGEHDQIYSAVPYWGLSTDLMPYMTSKGYESYAASVGPLSSAWDRACELYAQLTGTTVDYGAAHAAEYGHARYGATYDKPLFAGWSASKKINLVGHSFGGATIRLFLDILADGSAAEQAAAKAAGTEVSPFFEGGKADWVYSLTTLAAPHNGTTFLECCDNMAQFAAEASTAMAKLLGISDFKGVYDFQLEQFGFYRKDGETVLEALDRVCAGKAPRKLVAVSVARSQLKRHRVDAAAECAHALLEGCGLAKLDMPADEAGVLERGLDSLDVRMQAHFDRARALAEYLAANEMVRSVRYPGLSSHPDHAVATGILEHGFGPAVEFDLIELSAGELFDALSREFRTSPAGGAATRLSAPRGGQGSTIRLFAGTDDPLIVAATLDNALRN